MVGYAQDHEGYLLTVEDWLSGGYEPSINIWGPLQGEYMMEQALKLAALGRGERRVDHRGIDVGRPDYAGEPLGFEPLPEAAQSRGARQHNRVVRRRFRDDRRAVPHAPERPT